MHGLGALRRSIWHAMFTCFARFLFTEFEVISMPAILFLPNSTAFALAAAALALFGTPPWRAWALAALAERLDVTVESLLGELTRSLDAPFDPREGV